MKTNEKFAWKKGDMIAHGPGSPFSRAVEARIKAGLPVSGVEDEEILRWWAEMQKAGGPP